MQVAALPVGHFMARVLPDRKFTVFGRTWSMNPGPFNIKEHVLICVFANAGAAFGNGGAYAIGIVTIIKAFYKRNISFFTSLLLIITTQVLRYFVLSYNYDYELTLHASGSDVNRFPCVVHAGVGVRMGRADEEVCDRAGADVVAAEPGAGFSPEVSTDDSILLSSRARN